MRRERRVRVRCEHFLIGHRLPPRGFLIYTIRNAHLRLVFISKKQQGYAGSMFRTARALPSASFISSLWMVPNSALSSPAVDARAKADWKASYNILYGRL